jgi:hypothetical protein
MSVAEDRHAQSIQSVAAARAGLADQLPEDEDDERREDHDTQPGICWSGLLAGDPAARVDEPQREGGKFDAEVGEDLLELRDDEDHDARQDEPPRW